MARQLVIIGIRCHLLNVTSPDTLGDTMLGLMSQVRDLLHGLEAKERVYDEVPQAGDRPPFCSTILELTGVCVENGGELIVPIPEPRIIP